MLTRRRFLTQTTLAALLWTGGSRGEPDAGEGLPDGSAAKGMITPEAQRAIDQGLAYLIREQALDGSFGTGNYRGDVAITGLAGLALMAGGHQPGRGLYGQAVTRALDYVLSQDDGRGYLNNSNALRPTHGPMYSHGFGTLFLAEAHGMVHDKERRQRLRDTLKRAVQLIIQCQNHEGGWRYTPETTDADLSVTICQIMALRAARNAGFSVPTSTVNRCVDYVKKCRDPQSGGFLYKPQQQGTLFSRTAAGVVALYSAGIYKGKEIEEGLRYLRSNRPNLQWSQGIYYFYGHYYAVQAMWTAGGDYWSEWFPRIREELLSSRMVRFDGSWNDQICPHYGTAMACIILQVPNNYLPILQK